MPLLADREKEMTGVVTAIGCNAVHSPSKPNWDGVRLLAGLGVKGDAHLDETVKHRSACGEAVLRERARNDKYTARVLLPDPVTGGEQMRLLYIRDVGLIVAGPGLTTRPNAIETPTMRKPV